MFWGKSYIQKQKKRPLPGSLQTIVRSGEAPQMVAFSKLGNWQIQKQIMNMQAFFFARRCDI